MKRLALAARRSFIADSSSSSPVLPVACCLPFPPPRAAADAARAGRHPRMPRRGERRLHRGMVTNLGCVLRVAGMPEDRYVATIRKVGVDLGVTQESALAWGVYAVPGSAPAISRATTPARREVLRSGSASAAMCWLAARTIRSRYSAQRAGPDRISASPPGWRAWNFGRAGKVLSTSLKFDRARARAGQTKHAPSRRDLASPATK